MTTPATLPATKTCLYCAAEYGRPVPPSKPQSDTQWAARTYCGNACANAARKSKAEQWRRSQTKVCETCGDTYYRPAKVHQTKWDARTVCTRACLSKPKEAQCVVCDKPFKRNTPTARTCSRPCSMALGNMTRGRDRETNNKEPSVRIRSDKLPKDAPRKLWLEATATGVDVCCGVCKRRFPRGTVRQAEKLRDLHRRYCKPSVVTVSSPRGNGRTWTEAEDEVVRNNTTAGAAKILGRTLDAVMHRRKKLRGPAAPLSGQRMWTPDEDAVLAEIPDATEAGLKLGRSRMSVVQRRIRLARAAA